MKIKKLMVFMIMTVTVITLMACGETKGTQNDMPNTISEMSNESTTDELSEIDTEMIPEESEDMEANTADDDSDSKAPSSGGIRPEFKEAMDSYEAFF